MSFDLRLVFTITFFLFLTIFILTHKKGRQMHVWKAVPIFYAVMYRTKLGLKWMDRIGKKYTRLMRYYGYFGIFVGFAGMILIAILLIQNLIPLFTDPEAPSVAGLVFPVR